MTKLIILWVFPFFKELSRYLVGGLFIFSGLIKINDPVGTQIKLTEYFEVFSTDIAPFFAWFISIALFLSVFLSVLEVVLGVAVILGFQMKITSSVLLLMIIFFTFLTFYSAYFNKVTDCGCFGDAIKLTPWQSFWKDIVLLVLIIIIFCYRKTYTPLFSANFRRVKVIGTVVFALIIAIYAIQHLPFIDFRSYKVGNHLPTMVASEPLKYLYIMEKEGKIHEFKQYPSDTSYKYVDLKVLNPEVQPKIVDFAFWKDEKDYTDEMLTGAKLIILIHDTKKTSLKNIDKISDLLQNNPNYDSWVVTSSGQNEFEIFRHQYQLAAPYLFGDATLLKAIIRSNPGILLLENGTVRKKWHYNDVPLPEEIMFLLRN